MTRNAMTMVRGWVDVEEVTAALSCLAHNLAIAGGLCAAFDLGLYNLECANVYPSVRRAPGCGRSAP